MNRKIKIHFVCSGNVFRSRLAEAYAKSLQEDKFEITSSGVAAAKYPPEFLADWTKQLGRKYNLDPWLSRERRQTTSSNLKDSDIIVFLSSRVFKQAKANYDFNDAKASVWQVKDRWELTGRVPGSVKQKRLFKKIKHSVDRLFADISQGGWVEIVDENNRSLGFTLPITISNQKKLWHRSCHAIITTPNKRTLVQKRSSNIIFSPSYIDITLGGHLDPGEKPARAMVREIKEEIGIDVPIDSLKLLEVHKWSSYHPHYKRHTRNFLYSYHVPLDEEKPNFRLQLSEAAAVSLLSPRKLKRLIAYHRLKGLGKLSYAYAFYNKTAKLAGL